MRRALRHLRVGLFRHRYPPCCCLIYATDSLLRDRRGGQARRRGVCDQGARRWVPCMWHRGRHPDWRPLRPMR